jgi:hypothetical protein
VAEYIHGGVDSFDGDAADQRFVFAVVLGLHVQGEDFRIQPPAFLNFLTSIRS